MNKENLNPFNLVINLIFWLYDNVYSNVMVLFFRLWMFLSMGLLVWCVIALFLPTINFFEHLSMLFDVFVINPAFYLFHLFVDIAETIRVEYLIPETNGVKSAFFLLAWLFFIGLELVVMPLIWFGWVVFTYFGFAGLLTGETKFKFMAVAAGAGGTAGTRNISHLFMGRVSYDDIYKADAQANSIVEAFERKTGK